MDRSGAEVSETANYAPVSVEDAKGRILTGVGVTEASLHDAIDSADRTEEAPPEPAPDIKEPPPPEPEPTKRTHGQKRFAQLTAERETEARQRAAAEKERDDLKARLATLERAPSAPTTPAAPPAEPVTTPTIQTRAKPTEDMVGTTYPTYGDYVEDLADWKAEQRIAALNLDATIRTQYDRIEADRASRTLQDANAAAVQRGRAAYTDFDVVVTQSPAARSIQWAPAALQLIVAHPHSEHVRYGLATNPEKALALSVEPDVQKFLEGLDQFVPGAAVAPPASTGLAGMSIAPPPYQPVASGSKTTATPSADLVKRGGFDFDKSGYRERRAAERGVRRRG